jgi:hypothetical protein
LRHAAALRHFQNLPLMTMKNLPEDSTGHEWSFHIEESIQTAKIG